MENFRNEVKQLLKEKLGTDYSVEVADSFKNNDVFMKGLVIKRKDSDCGMVIYLDEYYKKYCCDISLNTITYFIMKSFEESAEYMQKLSDIFNGITALSDYESFKDRIMFKVLNTDTNKEYLKQVLCIPTGLDISICLYIRVEVGDEVTGTINITKQIADLWHVSETDLFSQAMQNMMEKFPYKVANIKSFLTEAKIDDEIKRQLMEQPTNMYKQYSLFDCLDKPLEQCT